MLYTITYYFFKRKGSPWDIEANMLVCDNIVSECKPQSQYYVHFWTNTLGKRMDPNYGLNSNTAVFLQGWL